MSFRKGEIRDKDQFDTLKFLTPVPHENNDWGCLSCLKGTSWEKEIPIIEAELYNEALLGWAKRFRSKLGTPPIYRAKRLPVLDTLCFEHQEKTCPLRGDHCRPGSGKLPNCYIPPFGDHQTKAIGAEVARAWDEGRYVFITKE